MGFPRQGYWSGFPFPSPGDLPDPGIKPRCPGLAGGFFTTEPHGKSLKAMGRMLSFLQTKGVLWLDTLHA